MQLPHFSRAFATMVVLSLTAGGVGGAAGCSVLTNTTAIQCRSDNECQALGPEFYGSACDLSTHVCTKVAEDADLCVATAGKSANQSCMEKFNGDPAICSPKSHRCVRLQTPECPVVVERFGFGQGGASDLINDNTVVVGLIDSYNCCLGLGNVTHYYAQLALEEIMQVNATGIPAAGGGPPRPMVLLTCPEGAPGRLEGVARIANHLANEVEVPLVVGPIVYDDLNLVYSRGLSDKRIPSILPFGVSRSDLQALPNPAAPAPLLYDLAPSAAEFVEMYRQLIVSQLEPRIRSSPGFSGDIRVAMITEKALGLRESEELLEQKLEFNKGPTNNGSVAANQAAGNYLKVPIADTTNAIANPNPQAEITAALQKIAGFNPHVVIHNVTVNLPPAVLFPLVYAIGSEPSLFKAYHLDIQASAFAFPDLIKIINVTNYPRGRVFSWAPHRSDADIKRADDLAKLIQFRFVEDPLVLGPVVYTPIDQYQYDSVYWAGYMIGAVGHKPLTAENFAAAIPLLTAKGRDATVITTGKPDAPAGFSAITKGQAIDLHGIASTLDVDPATGAVSYDRVEAWCLNKEGKPIPSGFYSDPATGSVGDVTNCD